jgi:hypothetical protein
MSPGLHSIGVPAQLLRVISPYGPPGTEFLSADAASRVIEP